VWWSSLADVEKVSGGKLNVPHFTHKKHIEENMIKMGLKVISVSPASYYSNWTHFFTPKEVSEGVFEWTLPYNGNTALASFAVEDMGLGVEATLDKPEEFAGKCSFTSNHDSVSSELPELTILLRYSHPTLGR
jgi:hypothetical protein